VAAAILAGISESRANDAKSNASAATAAANAANATASAAESAAIAAANNANNAGCALNQAFYELYGNEYPSPYTPIAPYTCPAVSVSPASRP
jgi:hypothetical protein